MSHMPHARALGGWVRGCSHGFFFSSKQEEGGSRMTMGDNGRSSTCVSRCVCICNKVHDTLGSWALHVWMTPFIYVTSEPRGLEVQVSGRGRHKFLSGQQKFPGK